MSIIKLTEGDHDDEWALELDDCFVILRFVASNGGVEVDYPAGQLQKWQQRAEGAGVSLEDYVIAVLDGVFDISHNRRSESRSDRF